MRPRDSASVLLTRGEGDALEVLLVERAPSLRFYGGFHAIPGGALDPADGEPGPASTAWCAARELFEETGLLLSPLEGRLAPEDRAGLRAALLAGDLSPWRAIVAGTAPPPLRTICTITTPAFSRRRFRNVFLHSELPAGQAPELLGGELVALRWERPSRALEAWRAGTLRIAPPVLLLVRTLAAHGLEGLFREAARIASRLEGGHPHPLSDVPGILTLPLLTPTVPPAVTTNCHLVGEERVYAVDPAPHDDGERGRLVALLESWRDEGRALAGVVLTHHHEDHVGAAEVLSRHFGVPVLAHALTLARLPFTPSESRALQDGDALELGAAPDGTPDWRLRAVFTPGHDLGHLCFLESRYGSLIAGDLCSTLSTIVIDPPEGHLATYLGSLRRVLGLPVRTLHPAHGTCHPDPPVFLRALLDHRADREARIVAALAGGVRTPADLLPEVYDDVSEELLPLASRSLLAGLEKLREDGRARARGGIWESAAGVS